jgi:hypothetical protein
MITKAEWEKMTAEDQWGYVIYVQGQIEGLIKALHMAQRKPNQSEVTQPTEHKTLQTVDEWMITNNYAELST